MSARSGTRLAVAVCAAGTTLFLAGIAFYLASAGIGGFRILSVAGLIVFSVVGVLVVSRQPRNPIGWIFVATTLLTGLSTLSDAYALYWLDGHGSRALGQAAAAYETAGWVPSVLIPATFLLLLFPDGRPLSPRWRWVARGAALSIACAFLAELTYPGELEDFPGLQNAYGIDHPLQGLLQGLSAVALLVVLIASPASLYLRYRRSSGRERQQIKWLAWAGALAGATVLIGSTLGYTYAGEALTNVVIVSSILALPVATGVAILRHRLYDVDVVINRTLVYGALTAALAASYLAIVLVLQLALGGLTAGSNLAVAASTLTVAALFRPARTRIQTLVDRRFYRNRYDAQRTLESFTARLRDQLELGLLSAELGDAVSQALRPAHVSLWLRDEQRP